MSDKCAADVSSVPSPSCNQLTRNNNPLLSASVTGITFDDFPNKPLLLPAAPPIVHSTNIIQGPLNKDAKLLVTVGHSTKLDNETLDEINLNTIPDDNLSSGNVPKSIVDSNNATNADSILSQAASSFSLLPTVASNVFSTFSKRLYPNNSGRENNSQFETSPNTSYNTSSTSKIQTNFNITPEDNISSTLTPSYVPHVANLDVSTSSSYLGLNSAIDVSAGPAEHLKLYKPADIPVSPPNCVQTTPPTSGLKNTYRLAAKKKIYAPIPGLSGQFQQPTITELQYSQNSVTTIPSSQQFHLIPESNNEPENEIKSGLFSLSNLVPTAVSKNISGFVQAATETFSPSGITEKLSISSPQQQSESATNSFPTLTTDIPEPFVPSPFYQQDNSLLIPTYQTNVPSNNRLYGQGSSLTPYTEEQSKLANQPDILATPPVQQLQINDLNLVSAAVFDLTKETVRLGDSKANISNLPTPPVNHPPTSAPKSSFRLQKGTKLYKNPLTAQETVPTQVNQVYQPLTYSADNPTIYNPFPDPLVHKENLLPTNDLKQLSGTFRTSSNTAIPFQTSTIPTTVPSTTSTALAENTKYLAVSENSYKNTRLISPLEQSALKQKTLPVDGVQKKDEVFLLSEEKPTDNSNLPTDLGVYVKESTIKTDTIVQPSQTLIENKLNIGTEKFVNPFLLQETLEEKNENIIQQSNTKDSTNVFPLHTCDSKVLDSSGVNSQIGGEPATVFFSTANNCFAENKNKTHIPEEQSFENCNQLDINNVKQTLPLECKTGIEDSFDHNQSDRLNIIKTEQLSKSSQSADIKQPDNFIAAYFNSVSSSEEKSSKEIAQNSLQNPITFFDNFSANEIYSKSNYSCDFKTKAQTNENQKIQNFFNNPPPKENTSRESNDLNYDLVYSGVAIKNLNSGDLTPISNIVEPPLSTCSEFSELNDSVENNKTKQQTEPDSASELPIVSVVNEENEELGHRNLETAEKQEMSNQNSQTSLPDTPYTPAVKHWFYRRDISEKAVWSPFSHYDSALLETSLLSGDDSPVAVEGGRFDVYIRDRFKIPVYWEGKPIEVRRCSWFYKGFDSKYIPYEEEIADLLENEYQQAKLSGEWHKKIILSMGEQVVFHGPTVLVHFQQQQNIDTWGSSSSSTSRPRVVKRDLDDFTIQQGETQRVDHLLFMVHGIGSACDLKMRPVEEVVDDFRSIAQQLVQSHYKNSCETGLVGRVEVLPISWHSHLHSAELGIDEKLKSITLESIPKLRNFTNDTLLDVLFYTSPTYCQRIMNTVASSLNAVYTKYRERNPTFDGSVSLAGHSLGSLILFDLLCHQEAVKETDDQNMENPDLRFALSGGKMSNETFISNQKIASSEVGYMMGPAGTGQPLVQYGQLVFHPKKFFALGSPIGMFVTIRGIDKLGLDFRLPTCPGFYNIFHPFDPVAYRLEALVNPDMAGIRPVLIAHHKGRKRMHLELKETVSRVGADLKQRFVDTFKSTLDNVNFFGGSARSKTDAEAEMLQEVDKALDKIEKHEILQHGQNMTENPSGTSTVRERTNSVSTVASEYDGIEVDFSLGKLNDSKRIDYVLQEAPLEFFNEYIFALSSHVCYWDSEDTILFVMKEIYSGLGITPDSQVPQQTMTIERPVLEENADLNVLKNT